MSAQQELIDLARDLFNAEKNLRDHLEPVAKRAGVNIKTNARLIWAAQFKHGHIRRMPGTVDFDVINRPGVIGVEVGPNVRRTHRQAELAGFAEYGSLNNAPRPGLGPALDLEAPVFEEYIGRAAEEVING